MVLTSDLDVVGGGGRMLKEEGVVVLEVWFGT